MATEQKTDNTVEIGDTVYVTKWLLSKGIIKAQCAQAGDKGIIKVKTLEGYKILDPLDWYTTLAKAKRRASFIIRRKRQSAEKLLAKLSELEQSLDTTTVKAKYVGRAKLLPYPIED